MYSFIRLLCGIFKRASLCVIGTIEDIRHVSEMYLYLNVKILSAPI